MGGRVDEMFGGVMTMDQSRGGGGPEPPAAVVLAHRDPVVRVLLGDADPLAGQAVTAMLSAETNVAVIGHESGALGLTRAVEACSPSVLVVDVGQRQFSGAGLLMQWIAAGTHVVILTTNLIPTEAVEYLRAGVCGVIDKADASLLVLAVRAAAAGQVFVAPTVSTPMVQQWRAVEAPPVAPTPPVAVPAAPAQLLAVPPGGSLTRQERAALVAVAAGYTTTETALQLGVSVGTLQGHMHRVIGKLGVKDRAQAVAWAYRSGLCPLPGPAVLPR